MYTTMIQGIPVSADPLLSQEQINHFVAELKTAWTWEDRQVGRIELRLAGNAIHIQTYEKPALQVIPYIITTLKE